MCMILLRYLITHKNDLEIEMSLEMENWNHAREYIVYVNSHREEDKEIEMSLEMICTLNSQLGFVCVGLSILIAMFL